MRSPEEARIRKLEERTSDYRGAIEEAVELLREAEFKPGQYDDKKTDEARHLLEPYFDTFEEGTE